MLYLHMYPFLKVLSMTFVVQTIAFQAKLSSQCIFEVIEHGYEIFQTILSLKTFSLVIHLSLISSKYPNLFSAICSEITVSDTNLILL